MGTAIIAKKCKCLRNHFYNIENGYIGSRYFGYNALMCYDFELDNNNIITIINFYKKNNAYAAKIKNIQFDYTYDELFFLDIYNIINEINDKNMIIFAGDFNADYNIRKRIENIGFKEITDHIESTMVEASGIYPAHNDCIFIKQDNLILRKEIDVKKVPIGKSPEYIYKNFSDHYGINCKMNL